MCCEFRWPAHVVALLSYTPALPPILIGTLHIPCSAPSPPCQPSSCHQPAALTCQQPALVTRRTRLPEPAEAEKRLSIWGFLKDTMGKDLCKVSVPISFNEPLSIMQKYCEMVEYSHLLDRAYEAGLKVRGREREKERGREDGILWLGGRENETGASSSNSRQRCYLSLKIDGNGCIVIFWELTPAGAQEVGYNTDGSSGCGRQEGSSIGALRQRWYDEAAVMGILR